MIEVGALCMRTCHITKEEVLCEIVSLYHKHDIDPQCPESVAIIPFVKAMWLTGDHQGQVFRSARRNFSRAWEVISDS